MTRKKYLALGLTLALLTIISLNGNTLGVSTYSAIRDIPSLPIRQPAEFEPMQGVLIRYPFGISYEIIAEMAEDVEVVTIVATSGEQSYVESQYQNHGINLSHCSFLIAPSDTYWTRDYGPWFIYTGNTTHAMVDFTYNRPYRPNDNAIPLAYATHQNLSCYTMDLVHTGGNYMTDGQGISVSTDLVWTENTDLTHEEINQTVQDYLGIHTYHVVPDVLNAYIQHIDCWAKYLAPDTIMIIEVPPTHTQYDDIEAAVHYFENQTSCYGTPYHVPRVYVHNDEPYINSLILNTKVLIPITGSSWDDDALAAYEAAMPGYEILGFTGSWSNTDALHCRAKGIPDPGMLYIEHTPLQDDEPTGIGFPVEATITPYSGMNLTNPPLLYWRTGTAWSSLSMTLQNKEGGTEYTAPIPGYPNNTQIQYYIHAMDNSGRNETHPYIGAPGAHTFTVHILPPNIQTIQVTPPHPVTGDYVNISATITDNKEITSVHLTLTHPDDTITNSSITQNKTNTTYYSNTTYTQAGHYSFTLTATDTSGTSTTSPPVTFQVNQTLLPFSLPLHTGWNLITLPHKNNWTAESLGKNISGCNLVLRFNGSTQSFETHVVGSNYDNFPIMEGVGYFVRVSNETIFSYMGLSIPGVNVTIYNGWNTLGWFHEYPSSAQSLGENTSASLVLMYDATTQYFMTYVMNSGYDNFIITRGMGVFIQTSTSDWWHGEG